MVSPTTADGCIVGESTIDILPNDALLTIFSLYKQVYSPSLAWWEPLVHVCRRWRHVILASPLLLNLTVVCTSKTPTRESLDIWPPLPIAIHFAPCDPPGDAENVVAALEQPDRVTDIRLDSLTRSDLTRYSVTMKRRFSVLRYLSLGWVKMMGDDEVVLPDGFLGGSAPSLQTLRLERLAFPGLPSLLSSTAQLVTLQLSSVPSTGYISPDAMATCLVALPNLQQLGIEFQPRFLHEFSQSLSTHAVLPSLAFFHFKGDSNYLEYLLTRIDAPMLQTFSVTFCDDIILLPQLLRFVSSIGRLGPPIRAMVDLELRRVLLKFTPSECFELAITSEHFFEHILPMICGELSPLLSQVERLDLYCTPRQPGIALSTPTYFNRGRLWLELLQPFISVKRFYVSKELWLLLGPSLAFWRGVVGEVFPELRTLFLEESHPSGPAQKSTESFVTLRQLSDRPITVQQCTPLDFDPKD